MNKVFAFLLLVMSIGVLPVNAEECKCQLAVVDMQAVLQEAPQIPKINRDLAQQFQGRQNKIKQLQTKLEEARKNLEKNASVMKIEDRNTLQKQIMNDRNTLQTLVVNFQQDVSKKQGELLHDFSLKVVKAATQIANKYGFKAVFQKGALLFVDTKLDITKQVLNLLQSNFKA